MMIRSLFAGKRTLIFTLFALAWMWNGCTPQYRTRHIPYDYSRMDKETAAVHRQVEAFLYKIEHKQAPIRLHPATRIDSLRIDNSHKELTVWLNNAFASIPFREKNVNALYALLRETLARPYKDYRLHLHSMGFPIGQLIPNYYRHTLPPDTTRFPPRDTRPPIVRRENQPMPEKGLYGNTIALWPSHGWYYNREQKRWMWQRARLFGTVEDLMPAAFTTPYLLPMLEKAGANVFVPRERDVNSNKVIVDNDDPLSTGYSEGASSEHISWQTGPSPGFGQPDSLLYGHQNPFRLGSWRHTQSDTVATAWARWAPVFPDSGRYAVYVSYRADNNHVEDARYTVHHLGGHTVFKVNQTMGGHTWIYLGTFRFARGYHPGTGSVMLSNISREKGRVVSADAVRFGGGMGIVAREGQTSGRPAFTEGARYWMQSAGFPDTLVYNLHADTNDYKDDYQGRGEWVNYLFGAPNGPNRDRSKGLGVPVDLSLAFHTDAGITNSDTAVGTLLIYSTTGADTTTFFPDGTSRLASRDFADILQSQLVDDIRALYDPSWSRRGLRNARYSEAFRPNVPAALLELLSHQNWADARFMLDPRFRFDVSRAIYKAMLRYLANREQRPYVVAPLPVDHFSAVLDSAGRVRLNWQPVSDPLEPSARPVAYKVYRRRDNGDFDNGRIVTQPFMTMPAPDAGHIHSYKVTALNEGGESFDSEILSVGRAGTDRPVVLVVNGFDRVSGPAALKDNRLEGFAWFWDQGVPDRYDMSFTGEQFAFKKKAKWHSDDRPGLGASYADYETRVIAGNTFDFPYIHGRAILKAGYTFVSCSDEALWSGGVAPENYAAVDVILGEEKATPAPRYMGKDSAEVVYFRALPKAFQDVLRGYLQKGGRLLISGAYLGSDLYQTGHEEDMRFAEEWLRFKWVTDHAVRGGAVRSVPDRMGSAYSFQFNTRLNKDIYAVESPDAIEGVHGGQTAWRYLENGFGAGVLYRGAYRLAAFGFPLETVVPAARLDRLMQNVLTFLFNDNE